MKREPNIEEARPGDKVRIKAHPNQGKRGFIRDVRESHLIVEIVGGGIVGLPPQQVTNFSLAARRAWAVMPKRAGRPKYVEPRKRMVSLRLDVDVWRRLSQAAEFGLIPSREEAVNTWLREILDSLLEQPASRTRERSRSAIGRKS